MSEGSWDYAAGSQGTVTVPVGAHVTHLRCESHSNTGAVVIFGGDSILVNGDAGAGQHQTFEMTFAEGQLVSKDGADDIVFSNMTSYFVGWIQR